MLIYRKITQDNPILGRFLFKPVYSTARGVPLLTRVTGVGKKDLIEAKLSENVPFGSGTVLVAEEPTLEKWSRRRGIDQYPVSFLRCVFRPGFVIWCSVGGRVGLVGWMDGWSFYVASRASRLVLVLVSGRRCSPPGAVRLLCVGSFSVYLVRNFLLRQWRLMFRFRQGVTGVCLCRQRERDRERERERERGSGV